MAPECCRRMKHHHEIILRLEDRKYVVLDFRIPVRRLGSAVYPFDAPGEHQHQVQHVDALVDENAAAGKAAGKTVCFDCSKREIFTPSSGLKALRRRLQTTYKVLSLIL